MRNNWQQASLGAISVDVSYGYTESASEKRVGPHFLRITDIQNGVVDWRSVPFCPITEKNHKKHKLYPGDIVVARTGNSTGENYLFKGGQDAVYASYLIRFKVSPEIANPRFVWYSMRSPSWWGFVNSSKTGSAQAGANAKVLGGFPLLLPPLSEQCAIAHVLGTLDDKIELNRKMNETLEAMAQAIFKSWFVDFDPVIDNALAAGNPIPDALQDRAAAREALGDERKPLPEDIRKLFPSEFELTDEMGWVPKGWGVGSINNEFNLTMGQSPPGSTYNKEGIGVIFFQGRTDFGFRYPLERVFCTQPKRIAKKNDTLVSVRAPVGDINLVKKDCCIGRGIAAIRHKSGSRSYTYYSMRELKKYFDNFDDTGTVFGSINQKDFKSIPWLKKPSKLIVKFEELVSSLDQKIEANTSDTETLVGLRDTLLPILLSGEIRIPDAEKLSESAA